jgi:hypothetical protein
VNTKRKVRPKNDPRVFEFELADGSLFPPRLTKGIEVALQGRRGRFRFQYASETSRGLTVLTFVGGPLHGQNDEFISVYPDRVIRIFNNSKTLVNINKEKKQWEPTP